MKSLNAQMRPLKQNGLNGLIASYLRKIGYTVVMCIVQTFFSAYAAEERISFEAFNQQLQSYIDTVNQTKLILDGETSTADAKTQQQALCQRIQAYQDIVKLTQSYPEFENALLMKMLAERYLAKQQASFTETGWNQSHFCPRSVAS